MDLNIAQLRTFVAAAELGSFLEAAQRVNRSPSAVSMQIMKLEETLGQSLFERHTRQIVLTPAGATLLPYARDMLQAEAQAVAALRKQDVIGRVVLGSPDDYIATLLPPVLERFARTFANVEIELVCTQSLLLKPMLRKGEIDLAFVTRGAGLDGTVIRKEPMVWVGAQGHEVWKKDPLPVALYEKGCVARQHTHAALERGSRRYRAAYSSPSLAGILTMVEAGLAVAALAECSVPPQLKRLGKAQGLPHVEALEIVLIKGRKNSAPAVDALAEQIVADLAQVKA